MKPSTHVALDLAVVRAQPAGVGVYATRLARALVELDPASITAIGVRDEATALRDALGGIAVVPFVAPTVGDRTIENYNAWLQLRADDDARATGASLVHYTNAAAPLRSRLPFVLTVHDLSVLRFPYMHPTARLMTLPVSLAAVARAVAIVVPSDAVRRELVRGLRVSPRRVIAIQHAPFGQLKPTRPTQVFSRFGLQDAAYLIAVGTIEPRKNLTRLVAAFERLAADHPTLKLVLVGSPGWRRDSIERRIAASPWRDRIILTGYLEEPEIGALVRSAAVVCYVSVYEGYGLPVIESLGLGAAVVTSNRSAMPEAAGGAAVLVNPYDVEDIVRGIRDAMSRRAELVAAGKARAGRRSWADVAREHMAVYDWAARATRRGG